MAESEPPGPRRVRIVGGDDSATAVVEEALSAFEFETVPAVSALSPGSVDAVVVVVPAIDVETATAVERVRRTYGETPVVVATDEVTATRADAVVPIDSDDVGRTVRRVLDGEQVDRTRRRVGRIVSLVSEFDDTDDGIEQACERLTDGIGYDTAWVVRTDESSVTPVTASGIPLSALRAVDADADDPWARALRSNESVLEVEGSSTVAVPFDDRCLVCTSDAPVSDAEVSALEHVVKSVSSVGAASRPRYALLGEAVAHEVNNQLDVAMVHLDLVDDDDEHLDHVEAALERIDDVVDEVNALVAPNLSTSAVSLDEVALEVWEGTSTNTASLETREVSIEADDRLARLLLSNLLRNAVQHGGEDVTVEVGPLDGDGFYVADDGAGVSEAAGEHLFEWGWSGEDGTGIGLALVSLVADRHGWDVEHSDADGARFEFRTG